jgi:CheY-like chemotaxis protein
MADDEPTLRATLARMLRLQGYDVTVAEDGAELLARYDDAALRRWPSRPADVIVSDVDMPRRDGFGVLEQLRDQRAATPVILMSGRCDHAMRERARALGAVGVLAKPFEMNDLERLIREAVATGDPAAPSPAESVAVSPATRSHTRRGG